MLAKKLEVFGLAHKREGEVIQVEVPGKLEKADPWRAMIGIWKDNGRFLASVIAPSRDNAAVLSGIELVPA